MDVGREHEQWEDMREIEFVDMRSYEAAEIDLWLNERGFQHKEMYRTVQDTELEVQPQADL